MAVNVALVVVACGGLIHCGTGLREGAGRATTASAIAEAQSSCAGVSDADRNGGPFLDRARIEGTSDLVESIPLGKTKWDHVRGAKVFVRAEPGVTRPWLARLAQCHVALGTTGPGLNASADDPFAVGRPEVEVDERQASFVIVIRGHDDDEGREIARRARGLVAR